MKIRFTKRKLLLLLMVAVTSILSTIITTNYINSNKKGNSIKSPSKELSTVASEYTSLDNRLTSLESSVDHISKQNVINPLTSVTVPSGSWKLVTGLILEESGTYLLVGHFYFSSNDTGLRALRITKEEQSTPGVCAGSSSSCSTTVGRMGIKHHSAPATGISTSIARINISTQTCVWICAYQNSGSSLNGNGYMEGVRLK